MTFWHGKKVLITGHTGFKGSWLSLWLQTLGAEVFGYAHAPQTKTSLFELTNVANGMVSTVADIRDLNNLHAFLKQHQPEIVIHMAAQALVRYSYQEPVETYATNVMGTVNLLEAIRLTNSVKAIINVTTDKCYENKEWSWGYRENDSLGGHDPYSNSKACSELVTAAYRNSYFQQQTNIGLATARAGNVIGGGDWAQDRLIPDIIHACINSIPASIRNPHALRPWQHVLEPLSGYLLLAQRLYEAPNDYAEGWNFGPNETDVQPVSWISDFIVAKWGHNASWALNKDQQPHETHSLKLDCSKARSRLNWQPRWNLEKGLEETINWYKAYQAASEMRNITLDQIDLFMRSNINPTSNKTTERISV